MPFELKRTSNYILLLSVGLTTVVFIISMVVVCISTDASLMLDLELMWVSIDTLVSLSLLGIGAFTVYSLKSGFGEHFKKEALKVSLITFLFCLGYSVHLIFDWVAYSQKKRELWESLKYKIWAEMVGLSILWTLLPVFFIYLLHLQNFSKLKDPS